MPQPAPPAPRPNPRPPTDPKLPPRRPRIPPRGTETETQPETQTDPETQPDGQTETETKTKTEDETECDTCEQCEPRLVGASVTRPAPQQRAAQKRGYDYQNFVCPWHWYDPASAKIEEWNFSGVDFDGLHPAQCHLYEAKHGYEGFLETKDWSAKGGPELREWANLAKVYDNVFLPMVRQGRRQHSAVVPHFGDVDLTWVFSHMDTRLYVGRLFLDEIKGWYHEMEVRPWMNG
ncbi:MAG: hypothetical protein ACJA2X_001410 [Halocynthiibacter sp.]